MTEPGTSLWTICQGAAAAGVVHVVLGPDHWAPLMAIGAERGWSARRAALVAAALGVVHCGATVLVVLALFAGLGGLERLGVLQGWRGDLAGMLLVGGGMAVALAGWRSRRRGGGRPAMGLSVAGAALLMGPCEWMLPAASSAVAVHGTSGALAACAVYSLATIVSMAGIVLVGFHAAPRRAVERRPGLVSGLVCTACGLAVLAGA